jgi:RND family efflux transporter MFP subunit
MLRAPRPLLSLLLCVFAGLACGRRGGAAAAGGRGPGGTAGRALPVRVAPVAVQDVVYQVKSVGSLEAEELVQVTAEVDGALAAVGFHEGDRVGRQTVLARIDPDRYRLEEERAEATHRKALADQARAEADLERREQLAGQQLVAVEELNRARQEAERLRAESGAAKAAWQWAAQNRARSAVRPSRAGVINTRTADTGQFVRAGTVIATLVDTSRLRLRFKVGEADSLRVKEGQTVAFTVAATTDRAFEGRVYHVGEVADPATRQVEVLAWVRNPGELKPGFFAEVTLATVTHAGALVVPEQAVQASERGFVVYAVEGGQARMRPVQVGRRTESGQVEIVSGLAAGQTVIVEGSDRLVDGAEVQPAEGPGAAPGRAGPRGAPPGEAGGPRQGGER